MRAGQAAVAGAVYFLLTLLYFYPCLPALSTSLIGPPEDNMQFYWFVWHGAESLLRRDLPFMRTSLIYYPEGVSLLYANYFYYGIFLAAVLKTWIGATVIFNCLVLHSFILAGIGAFLLTRELTGDFAASLAGGFVFAFNPSHYAHSLHHVTIASIQFVPFFVFFFIKAVKEKKALFVILAAVFMSLGALCDWNYFVFSLVFIFLSYLYLVFRKRRVILPGELRAMGGVALLSFLALSPLVVPMIYLGLTASFKRDLPGHDIYVADILGFFIPHPYHLFSSAGWVQAANQKMTGNDWEKSVYLGWVNLAAIGIALKAGMKGCGKYLLGLGAFMVLATGVRPHFLGEALSFPLPYKIIQILPFFSNARSPSRIIVYAYLFLAVLTAFSIKYFRSLKSRRGVKTGALAAVFLLLVLDFYSTCRAMTPVSLPRAYDAVVRDPGRDFGMLELPWDGARYMMAQTIHGIPNVQGYVGRRVERVLNDTLTYDLGKLDRQKEQLVENHVKYIVIFKRRLDWDRHKLKDLIYAKTLEAVCAAYSKTYEKIYEDGGAAVFRVYR